MVVLLGEHVKFRAPKDPWSVGPNLWRYCDGNSEQSTGRRLTARIDSTSQPKPKWTIARARVMGKGQLWIKIRTAGARVDRHGQRALPVYRERASLELRDVLFYLGARRESFSFLH